MPEFLTKMAVLECLGGDKAGHLFLNIRTYLNIAKTWDVDPVRWALVLLLCDEMKLQLRNYNRVTLEGVN